MKKRMISIILIATMALLCGCNKEEPKTKTIWLLQKEEQVKTTQQKDYTTNEVEITSSENIYSVTYEYDSYGNVVTESRSNNDKEPTTTTYEYQYGENGQILRETIRKNGSISADYRYTYDDRGNMVNRNSASVSGHIVETFYTYDNQNRILSESNTSDPKLAGTVYTYDDENRTQTITEYVNNEIKSEQVITFDEQGRRIKEIPKSKLRLYTYEYEDGKAIQYTWHLTNGEVRFDYYDKLISSYDSQGRLIQEENVTVFVETFNGEEIIIESTRLRDFYSYDDNGNLTQIVDEYAFYLKKDEQTNQWIPDYATQSVTTYYTYIAIEVPA